MASPVFARRNSSSLGTKSVRRSNLPGSRLHQSERIFAREWTRRCVMTGRQMKILNGVANLWRLFEGGKSVCIDWPRPGWLGPGRKSGFERGCLRNVHNITVRGARFDLSYCTRALVLLIRKGPQPTNDRGGKTNERQVFGFDALDWVGVE